MKRHLILSLSLFVAAGFFLLTQSCSKLTTLNLSKTYSDIEFTITAPQAAGLVEFEKEIEADLQGLASSSGFDINKIESATLKSITFTIHDTNAVPYTFDIVDNASCSFEADGIAVAEVGSDDGVQTSPTQMDFDLNGTDVAPYLKSSKFKVKMKMTTNAPITHNVPMKASIQCSIKVKPLK